MPDISYLTIPELTLLLQYIGDIKAESRFFQNIKSATPEKYEDILLDIQEIRTGQPAITGNKKESKCNSQFFG